MLKWCHEGDGKAPLQPSRPLLKRIDALIEHFGHHSRDRSPQFGFDLSEPGQFALDSSQARQSGFDPFEPHGDASGANRNPDRPQESADKPPDKALKGMMRHVPARSRY